MTQTPSLNPSDVLINFIVALLAPMFLGVADGNIGLARAAAAETVNAYRARNHADLIAVAQIIAFGLATLGSLSLSMDDDISIPMALRLRGNANALNRSAEQNRRVLRENPREAAPPPPVTEESDPPYIITESDAEALLAAAAAQQMAADTQARLRDPEQKAAAPASDKRNQTMWAIAMVKEASEINASLPHLPPAERKAAALRAAVLGSTANQLLTGVAPLPQTPASSPGRP